MRSMLAPHAPRRFATAAPAGSSTDPATAHDAQSRIGRHPDSAGTAGGGGGQGGGDDHMPSPGGGWHAMAILLAVAALVGLALAFMSQLSAVQYFGRVEGWVAVVLAPLAALEYFACRHSDLHEHSSNAYLERVQIVHAVAWLPLAVVALTVPTSKASVLVVSGAIFALGAARGCGHLHRRGAERRRRRRDAEAGRVRDVGGLGSPRAIWRLLLAHTARIGSVTAATVLLAVCVAAASDAEGITLDRWRQPPRGSSGGRKDGSGPHPKAEPKAETPKDPGRLRSQLAPDTAKCRALRRTDGWSRTAIDEIESHFKESAIAASELGCPTETQRVLTTLGYVYWADGYSEGDPVPKGMVVVTPGAKPFVVLRPAVGYVEGILNEAIPLSAPREFPRYYAGQGSFLLLWSPRGSFLLEQEQLQKEGQAVPFTMLPPISAADAVGQYAQAKRWLWAFGPRKLLGGTPAFELRDPVSGLATTTVLYHPPSAASNNLGLEEVRRWAPPIPPGEQSFEAEVEQAEQRIAAR